MRRSQPYHVRADWVWNLTTNPGLTGTATLQVRLTHPEPGAARTAVDDWLAGLGSSRVAGREGRHRKGGCAIEVRAGDSPTVELLLSSRGQDALESLDDLVQRFQTSILRQDDRMLLSWTELPISDVRS